MVGIETHSSNFSAVEFYCLAYVAGCLLPFRPGMHEHCLESLLKTSIWPCPLRPGFSKSRVGPGERAFLTSLWGAAAAAV